MLPPMGSERKIGKQLSWSASSSLLVIILKEEILYQIFWDQKTFGVPAVCGLGHGNNTCRPSKCFLDAKMKIWYKTLFQKVVASRTGLGQAEEQTLEREAGQPVTLECQVNSSCCCCCFILFCLFSVVVVVLFVVVLFWCGCSCCC